MPVFAFSKTIAVLAASALLILLACLSLPASLYWEHRENFPVIVQAFPHLTIYPSGMAAFVFLALALAARASIVATEGPAQRRRRRHLWTNLLISGGVAVLFVMPDSRGNQIMLFEFRPGLRVPFATENSLPADVSVHELGVRLLTQKVDTEHLAAAQSLMTRLTRFDTWSDISNWNSLSRWLYLLVTFIMVTEAAFCFLLLTVPVTVNDDPRRAEHRLMFLWLSIAAAMGLIAWFPFRHYYNVNVRPLLWGSAATLGPADLLIYVALALFCIVNAIRLVRSGADRLLVAVATVVGLAAPAFAGFQLTAYIDATFGLRSQPIYWLLWPAMVVFVVMVIYANRSLLLGSDEA
jgi:hypothetical protein